MKITAAAARPGQCLRLPRYARRYVLVRCAVALRGTTGSPLFALPRLRQIRAASEWWKDSTPHKCCLHRLTRSPRVTGDVLNVLSCAAWRTQDNGSAKANMHASKEWLHDFGEQTGCVTNGWQREYIVFLGHSSSGDGGVGGGGGGRRLGSRRLGSRR